MPWDRKRLLGYVETMRVILGVTDKEIYEDKLGKSGDRILSSHITNVVIVHWQARPHVIIR